MQPDRDSLSAEGAATPRPGTRDALAGATGALATLANVLTQGLLAFTALGVAGPALGIPAAFVSVVLGGLLFAALGRGPMPAGGPASAGVLVLASLVFQVVRDPVFDVARPDAVRDLLALTGAAVVGMGVLQAIIAVSGAVRLAKFVPQPVLAGFMNGVAVLVFLAQVPALLGWPVRAGDATMLSAWNAVQPATLAIGVFTIACIVLAPRVSRRIPATFLGLVAGVIAYYLLVVVAPGLALGPPIGALPDALPRPDALAPWLSDSHGLLRRHAAQALTTSLLLALVGTLDLVLNGLAVDQALRARTDPRHELLAISAANVASGLIGGLPVLLLRGAALATARAGGRSPGALVVLCVLLGVLGVLGAPLLARLPQVVLAGVMVMIAWMLADQWTRHLLSQWWRGQRTADVQLNLVVVGVVCVVTVVFGFVVGVAVGAVLAVMLLIHSMNRSLVRTRYTAAMQPSRRIFGAGHEAVLRELRPRIAVLELEGALFFGSADRLAGETAGLADCRCLVLDFKRVSLVDASGAVVLAQIGQRLAARGTSLSLAGVAAGNRHGQALREFAGAALPPEHWYVDVDQAVEAAELRLLAEAPGTLEPVGGSVPLERSLLMVGLDDAARRHVTALLTPHRMRAGDRLFREGEAGDCLYVLTEGSISIVSTDASTGRVVQRYVSFSPGMMFGEMAMLDGSGRSADAVADSDAEVWALSRAALGALSERQPALCAQVYRNIALHLTERLRAASIAWRASAA